MAVLEPGHDRKRLRSQVVWFAFWVCVTIIGAVLHPDKSGHGTHQQLGLLPCPSVLLFNRPCPGCGLTTSWTALIHGQFLSSFRAHPLGPPLYLLFSASAFLALYGYIKRLRFATDSPEFNRIIWVTVGIFMSFGLYRMATTPHFGTIAERWFL